MLMDKNEKINEYINEHFPGALLNIYMQFEGFWGSFEYINKQVLNPELVDDFEDFGIGVEEEWTDWLDEELAKIMECKKIYVTNQ